MKRRKGKWMETHQVLRTALALLFKRALGMGTDLKNGAFLLLSFQKRNYYTSGRGISLQSLKGRPPGGMCQMQAALPRVLPGAGCWERSTPPPAAAAWEKGRALLERELGVSSPSRFFLLGLALRIKKQTKSGEGTV